MRAIAIICALAPSLPFASAGNTLRILGGGMTAID